MNELQDFQDFQRFAVFVQTEQTVLASLDITMESKLAVRKTILPMLKEYIQTWTTHHRHILLSIQQMTLSTSIDPSSVDPSTIDPYTIEQLYHQSQRAYHILLWLHALQWDILSI